MRKKKKKLGPIEKLQQRWGLIFVLPCIIGLLCFSIGPILYSLILSFHDWNIVNEMRPVGLENYRRLMSDELTWQALKVTFYYSLISVPGMTITSFFVAMLLNTKLRGMAMFRTIFYIPSIIPLVVSCAVWMNIFNPKFGVMNSILDFLSLPRSNFVFGKATVVPSLAFMAVWGAGNLVVIFLAGLQGVSRQLYEAAEIDGAGFMRRFAHVTAPLMTPIIFYNVVMSVINCMQTFTQPYIMTEGGPNNASLFYSLMVYNYAFKYQSMGYAAALSWVLFVIIGVFTVVLFSTSSKWVFYESGDAK